MAGTKEYWEDAALKRELSASENARFTSEEVLKLYEEALDNINEEIRKIQINFRKRYGIDEKTAAYFLDEAQREENLINTINALDNAPDGKARENILDFIHRDGFSKRAYAARSERYNAVKDEIYARMVKLASDETALVGAMLKKTYAESYYGAADDIAKGLDMGVNLSMLNDRAINEAISHRWHGSRFSERVWKNTDELSRRAQAEVVKSIISGEDLEKTAKRLADEFGVAKYRAVTLVRTENAHIHNKANLDVYKELGFEEYKYLATLDYITCTVCQPLDGMVFKVSEAREGENHPVMHPRCRCTTTINMEYEHRAARNPVTGKSYRVDGDITYKEWVKKMTPEQKEAFELAKKKNSRKISDKLQHEKYKKVLGTKNIPRSFDKFQNLKYNDTERWEELKRLYRSESRPVLQERLDYVWINNEKNFIPAKTVMSSAKTIAGKGSKKELRIESRLIEKYGGAAGEWKKRVGKIESEKYTFDVHWYELDGKQYGTKLKYRKGN